MDESNSEYWIRLRGLGNTANLDKIPLEELIKQKVVAEMHQAQRKEVTKSPIDPTPQEVLATIENIE
jgi:hypothetical protein